MKKYLLIVLAFTALASTAVAQNGAKNKKAAPTATETYSLPGFRDILWGTHIDSVFVDGVKLTFEKSTQYNDKSKNAYFIANDDMMVGTVVLKTLYYVFNNNDRFIGVIMTGESKQFGEMKYILLNKFGQPTKEEDAVSGKQYYWNIDDVRISLVNESINQLFTVDFTSDYELSESKKVNRNVDDF